LFGRNLRLPSSNLHTIVAYCVCTRTILFGLFCTRKKQRKEREKGGRGLQFKRLHQRIGVQHGNLSATYHRRILVKTALASPERHAPACTIHLQDQFSCSALRAPVQLTHGLIARVAMDSLMYHYGPPYKKHFTPCGRSACRACGRLLPP
jgi:hypothetical protein